jgi:hypothetical protein
VWVKGIKLKDESNVPVAGMPPGHVAPVQQNYAACGRLQPRDHAQRGRLAAAGRAEQYHKFAIADGQVHGLDGMQFAELFLDLTQFYFSHVFQPITDESLRR